MRVSCVTPVLLFLVACGPVSQPVDQPTEDVAEPLPTCDPPQAAAVTRLAFGSCIKPVADEPPWEAILAFLPDLFVFCGDNIYADTDDPAVIRECYAGLERREGFRRLREAAAVDAVWDDHDYGRDDAGAEYPAKEASEKIFLDFWRVPVDSPRRARPGIYGTRWVESHGRRVQLLLLDTRYFRSDRLAPDVNEKGTVLGAEQWAWLEAELRKPADLRVLVSSIQVLNDRHEYECWGKFPAERRRLLELVKATGAARTVIVSGDMHICELSRLAGGFGYDAVELTTSGLNVGWPEAPVNPLRVGGVYLEDNWGTVMVDWDAEPPAVRLCGRAADGKSALTLSMPLAELEVQSPASSRR